ncbi:unnamed protein product, partial [Ectocarpus sp. 12 AP-2014]
MTTAHRPTWAPAQAAASDVGNWSTGGRKLEIGLSRQQSVSSSCSSNCCGSLFIVSTAVAYHSSIIMVSASPPCLVEETQFSCERITPLPHCPAPNLFFFRASKSGCFCARFAK